MNDTQASELEGWLFDIAIRAKTEVPVPRLAVAQIIHAIMPTVREWLDNDAQRVSYGLYWDRSGIRGERQ